MKIETSWPSDPINKLKAEEEFDAAKLKIAKGARKSSSPNPILSITDPVYRVGIVSGIALNTLEFFSSGDTVNDNLQFGPVIAAGLAAAVERIVKKTKPTPDTTHIEILEAKDRILRKHGGITMIEGVSYKVIT